MKLLNEGIYFKRLGDGFVYRPTIFSAGFSVSPEEKDRLFSELLRLERRFLIEGLILIALIAGMFMAGLVTSPTPIPWFVILSICAVVLLAPVAIHRKYRLTESILGRTSPDVPRMPLRQALTQPRPILAKRYTIPILRSMIVLFLPFTVVVDGLALSPILAVLLPQEFLDQLAKDKVIAEALSQTLYNPTYWAVVALINVILLACIRLLLLEIRRLRAHPDLNEPDRDSSSS
jgi:hypothetical protein